MRVLTSEAVVLRTWPVHEADLIVSFFTRDYGRVRGVAKSALKSRKRFGGALEPMTVARAWFAERPRQELVRLDQLEIMRSPLSRRSTTRAWRCSAFLPRCWTRRCPTTIPRRRSSGCWCGAGADHASTALDAADLFPALDDAPHGAAARHRPLHRLWRGVRQRRFVQQLDGWPFLRAASQRERE